MYFPKSGMKAYFPNEFKGYTETKVQEWKRRKKKYEFTQPVIAEEMLYCSQITENQVIAAFVGNVCRGLVKLKNVNQKLLFFLTSYANNEQEMLVFKLINKQTSEITELDKQINFGENNLYRSLAEPVLFTEKAAVTATELL